MTDPVQPYGGPYAVEQAAYEEPVAAESGPAPFSASGDIAPDRSQPPPDPEEERGRFVNFMV
ncbi:MAG: hypothetical protein AB7E47_17380 [Desulfovibrionaceae bacterium]